jgi:hypothetical protein
VDEPERSAPKYGENVVSWISVWDRFYPSYMEGPHDDAQAAEMQRLKGLVVCQAAEVEAALGELIKHLAPNADIAKRTAGQLARGIRRLLGTEHVKGWKNELSLIDRAVESRNRAAHFPVRIGSSWAPYATGGGEWVPVTSLLGNELYDEMDLRQDLAIQQDATEAAVHILHSIQSDPADLRSDDLPRGGRMT